MSNETRQRLIRRGIELFSEFGSRGTGLDGLLRSSGVTKGSFYHFFCSKQAFTLEVIESYEAYFEERFSRILEDRTLAPLERLRNWMDEACRGVARHGFRRGCLVGNLSQELGPHEARIRVRLQAVFRRWEDWIFGVLEEARSVGDLASDTDCRHLARVFWTGWQGAILRAKLEGDTRPMRDFGTFFLDVVAVRGPICFFGPVNVEPC